MKEYLIKLQNVATGKTVAVRDMLSDMQKAKVDGLIKDEVWSSVGVKIIECYALESEKSVWEEMMSSGSPKKTTQQTQRQG